MVNVEVLVSRQLQQGQAAGPASEYWATFE
jgi:hypothetical protein